MKQNYPACNYLGAPQAWNLLEKFALSFFNNFNCEHILLKLILKKLSREFFKNIKSGLSKKQKYVYGQKIRHNIFGNMVAFSFYSFSKMKIADIFHTI